MLWMKGIFSSCFYRTEVLILHTDTNTNICKKEKKNENHKDSFLLQERNFPEIVTVSSQLLLRKQIIFLSNILVFHRFFFSSTKLELMSQEKKLLRSNSFQTSYQFE